MADNVGYTPGSGAVVAADEIGGVLFQRVKLAVGEDGSATDASLTSPVPVQVIGELVEAVEAMRMAVQSLTRSIGQAMPDTAGRLRVNMETGATLAAVTTLSTLTNQTQIGGLSATEQIPSLMRLGADSMRRNISVT